MDNTTISAKQIILNYFNDTLFEKGIITEKEKNKMVNIIYRDCKKNTDKKIKGNP